MKTREKRTTYCYVKVTFTETIEMEYDCSPDLKNMVQGEYRYQENMKESAAHLALGRIKRTDISDSEWQRRLNIKTVIL